MAQKSHEDFYTSAMFQPMFLLVMPDFSDPAIWISLLTLTFLEIVLGVDNVIFISIVANKLPQRERKRGRNIGLTLALVFRIGMLLGITWLIGLTKPLFTIDFLSSIEHGPFGISAKDLILMSGGVFLLYKSIAEIREKMNLDDDEDDNEKGETEATKRSAFWSIIGQIVLVDIVFSFDSILTAVGLTSEVIIMIIAVIISILLMMKYSGAISTFINTHPTMQMLALSFLILIGAMLIAEGFHQHVNKAYIYFAIAFSLSVELVNMRLRRKQRERKQKKALEQESA